MRLKIQFGTIDSKEVVWWKDIDSFPHLIRFLGRNYEWVIYDKDLTGKVDMILLFSELPNYDPNYDVDCPLWSDLFPDNIDGCACGAAYTAFPTFHMFFCPKWKKW